MHELCTALVLHIIQYLIYSAPTIDSSLACGKVHQPYAHNMHQARLMPYR